MSTLTAMPSLTAAGIEFDPQHLGLMRDSSDIAADPVALRARMQEEGYLYLPGYLHREEVLAARAEIARRLLASGRLDPNHDPMDCIPISDEVKLKSRLAPVDMVKDNAALRKVIYDGPMVEFFAGFLGGPVRHFDYTWLRVMGPGNGTPSHCDVVYMGRGTHNLYTAWTPLGDIPFEVGGLVVLEGSNNHDRLKRTYGQSDVDTYCTNRKEQRDAWAKGSNGHLGENLNQIRNSLGMGRWLTHEYRAGDVVLFSVFTVHGSVDNHSNQIRLSSDTRYQLASDPVDERWIGENPPAHGPNGKRGKIC